MSQRKNKGGSAWNVLVKPGVQGQSLGLPSSTGESVGSGRQGSERRESIALRSEMKVDGSVNRQESLGPTWMI